MIDLGLAETAAGGPCEAERCVELRLLQDAPGQSPQSRARPVSSSPGGGLLERQCKSCNRPFTPRDRRQWLCEPKCGAAAAKRRYLARKAEREAEQDRRQTAAICKMNESEGYVAQRHAKERQCRDHGTQ